MHTDPAPIIRAAAVLQRSTFTRATDTAVALPETAAGELDARLIPWNVPADVSDDGGRSSYTEVWEPGSAVAGDRVAVYGSHRVTAAGIERGPLIGIARNVRATDDGLHATIALADTPTARDVRELARLVGAFVSVEAAGQLGSPGETLIRTAADPAEVTGVAVILPPQRPAHAGAEVLAVRAASPTDPDPDDPDDPDADPDDDPDAGQITRGAVAELVRAEIARTSHRGTGVRSAHPLARFRTAGDYWLEASRAPSANPENNDRRDTLARALADQVTTDNPGVVPPGWVTEIQGIMSRPRVIIGAFGPFPDPGYGTTIEYPLFTGDLSTMVGTQTTPKTAITSVKVSIGKGSATLETLAGGSDLSYQLIRRSSPSYRDAYLRIMASAYALVSEKHAGTQMAAMAVDGPVWAPATGNVSDLLGALFAASAQVDTATGAPASFVLAAPDVFGAIGGLQGLWPAPYGTANAAGVATASTLRINVSGLEIYNAPGLAAGTMIVSNTEAGGFVEDGPFVVTAEDVELLGQNVAIWGMGAFVGVIPAGIVSIGAALTASARGAK